MALIYANAYLTIAAELAKDTSTGCFSNRPLKKHVVLDYQSPEGIVGQLTASLSSIFHETCQNTYLDMTDNPLTKRAWVMQERLLSRRVLHFEKDQLCFECDEEFLTESGVRLDYRYHTIREVRLDGSANLYKCSSTIERWCNLVNTYCNLDLTFGSDKLPALSGIARIYKEKLDDQYVAGLWRNSIIKGLYWHGDDEIDTSTGYRAPSWSWAAREYPYIDCGILYRSVDTIKELAVLVDYHIELKGSNPYGEITGGWIKLQAPLQPLFLTGSYDSGPREPEGFYNIYLMVKTATGNPSGCEARWDYKFWNETTREDGSEQLSLPEDLKIFALVLTSQFSPHSTASDVGRQTGYCCLIIGQNESNSKVMRRLGHFWMDRETMGQCTSLDSSVELPVTTLV